MPAQEKNLEISGAIFASLYVSFQVISNILSTKIAVVPLVNMATDAGTILYPLTFTLRDFVHKTLGKANSRKIVLCAAGVSFFAAVLFWLVGKWAPDSSWTNQTAFESVLMPVWRVTLASVVAQLFSELVDTEVFSLVYKKLEDIQASLFSNLVALVLDSVVFSVIAFFGSLPGKVLLQIILTNILLKTVISLFSSPFVRLIPRQVEIERI